MSGQFTLELRAEPGNWPAPVDVRLRRALKTLLRGYGLRCTHVGEVSPGSPAGRNEFPLTAEATKDLFAALRAAAALYGFSSLQDN